MFLFAIGFVAGVAIASAGWFIYIAKANEERPF